MCNIVVETVQGKLKGEECFTKNNIQYYVFKGIPYAKPPVGERRFSIPQPPEPWNGVRDATIDCNKCAQWDAANGIVIGDEDCLYLNVYTPKLPKTANTSLPVMVYFHGGGFRSGNGTVDGFGPEYLIEKNVVLVSLNYRLGILGFLCLNRKEATGNMGLKDQVEALKWVKQNIKAFNGDPNNVTIFGISAGGASVEYHMLSSMSKGLYHKAIAQSGSTLNPWTHSNNVKDLAYILSGLKREKITNDEDLYKYLLDLPVKELVTLAMDVVKTIDSHKGGLFCGFVPTLEKSGGDWDPFICEATYNLLSQGEFTVVPFVTGYCNGEGLLLLSIVPKIIEELRDQKNFIDHLPFNIDGSDKLEIESKLKTIYLNSSTPSEDFVLTFLGDVDFFSGIYTAANLIAKKNPQVYAYEFSYDGGLNYLKKNLDIEGYGACHADDGGYLIKTNMVTAGISQTDELVRRRMVEMWTNFAKTGNPTPNINDVVSTTWEPLIDTGFRYLEINDELVMKDNMQKEKTTLFMGLYKKHGNAINW